MGYIYCKQKALFSSRGERERERPFSIIGSIFEGLLSMRLCVLCVL